MKQESQLERRERNLKNAKALLSMSQTEGWKVISGLVEEAIEKNKARLCDLRTNEADTKALRIEIGFKKWLLNLVSKATPELIAEEEDRITPLREKALERQDSGQP